jgi:hypothetical protein
MRCFVVIGVLSAALVVAATFAIWQAAGAPWQAHGPTPMPPPTHRWSETEAAATVEQAIQRGYGLFGNSCTASPSESASEWLVTCGACQFVAYENSNSVRPVERRCWLLLVPRQQECPACECNY